MRLKIIHLSSLHLLIIIIGLNQTPTGRTVEPRKVKGRLWIRLLTCAKTTRIGLAAESLTVEPANLGHQPNEFLFFVRLSSFNPQS